MSTSDSAFQPHNEMLASVFVKYMKDFDSLSRKIHQTSDAHQLRLLNNEVNLLGTRLANFSKYIPPHEDIFQQQIVARIACCGNLQIAIANKIKYVQAPTKKVTLSNGSLAGPSAMFHQPTQHVKLKKDKAPPPSSPRKSSRNKP